MFTQLAHLPDREALSCLVQNYGSKGLLGCYLKCSSYAAKTNIDFRLSMITSADLVRRDGEDVTKVSINSGSECFRIQTRYGTTRRAQKKAKRVNLLQRKAGPIGADATVYGGCCSIICSLNNIIFYTASRDRLGDYFKEKKSRFKIVTLLPF